MNGEQQLSRKDKFEKFAGLVSVEMYADWMDVWTGLLCICYVPAIALL